jgi:hypothetical protein
MQEIKHMQMYHFVSKWVFNAPIEKLWSAIIDLNAWPRWSKGFKCVMIRGQEPLAQFGTIADCAVKGSLPYTLRFTLKVSVFQPPKLLEVTSMGDLVGNGTLMLAPRDKGTAVTYNWDVGTTNPILNLAGKLPFVRKLLEKNHDEVMENAFLSLKDIVESVPQ